MDRQGSDQRIQPQQGLSPATLAAHAGRPRKPFLADQSSTSQAGNPLAIPHNAHVMPLFQTSVFDFDSISSGLEQVVGQGAYGYGRMGLPNAHKLGSAIAALEGAEEGVATSSGMGAISAAVLSSVGSGDVVITQHDVYGGTIGFLKSDLPRFGATVLFEDTNNLKHLEKLLFGRETVSLSGTLGTSGKEDSSRVSNADEEQCPIGERCSEEPTVREGFVNGGTHREASSRDRGVEASTSGSPACGGLVADVRGKGGRVLIFVETVSNPLLVVSDVRAIAALSKRAGALLIVDNTFGTPLRSRPLSEGADLVVHSATKFLGGHHDLLAGAVVGSSELVDPVREFVKRLGLWAAPLDAWLAVRGIRTLQVRVEKAWANASVLGRRLERDPRIKAVVWHDRVALVTFAVVGGFRGADAAVKAFKLITLSTTLGGVTTTVSHPASSSHAPLTADQRAKLGISDGHLRFSVGIEGPEDLWADLDRGLTAAAALGDTDKVS